MDEVMKAYLFEKLVVPYFGGHHTLIFVHKLSNPSNKVMKFFCMFSRDLDKYAWLLIVTDDM